MTLEQRGVNDALIRLQQLKVVRGSLHETVGVDMWARASHNMLPNLRRAVVAEIAELEQAVEQFMLGSLPTHEQIEIMRKQK